MNFAPMSMTTAESEDVFVYTIASDESKLQYLLYSAEMSKTNIHVHLVKNWKGFIDKITCMKEILRSHLPNHIICFVDAYDVLCFADIAEIRKKFLEYNCNILLGCELNCYPDRFKPAYEALENSIREQPSGFFHGLTKYKYVNSGGYIGYCKDLQDMLDWKTPVEAEEVCSNGGDQNYFTEYYLTHALDSFLNYRYTRTHHILLDSKQVLFQNMHRVNWKEMSFINGRFYNQILNSHPCFVHVNGYSYCDNKLWSFKKQKQEDIFEAMVAERDASMALPTKEHTFEYTITCFVVFRGVIQETMTQL